MRPLLLARTSPSPQPLSFHGCPHSQECSDKEVAKESEVAGPSRSRKVVTMWHRPHRLTWSLALPSLSDRTFTHCHRCSLYGGSSLCPTQARVKAGTDVCHLAQSLPPERDFRTDWVALHSRHTEGDSPAITGNLFGHRHVSGVF